MEKKIGSKEVKMNAIKSDGVSSGTQTQKLSYEELNQACMELSQQNQKMQQYIQNIHRQLKEMNDALQIKRMDYLFKVLELEAVIKDSDFVGRCVDEIKEALTIPEQQGETEEEG